MLSFENTYKSQTPKLFFGKIERSALNKTEFMLLPRKSDHPLVWVFVPVPRQQQSQTGLAVIKKVSSAAKVSKARFYIPC